MNAEEAGLKNLIVVGDRVLIRPRAEEDRTSSGLFLPPGVSEREETRSGWVIKTGPGYALPMPPENEVWKQEERIKYVPLQAQAGDLAIFLQKGAWEIMYRGEKYYLVPQAAILLLERDEGLFD